MELTPIRVRGRRKRNRPPELDAVSNSQHARLQKIARFNHAGLSALKKRPRKDPKLSDFEQLPTEIVQVIFEYSNNISLPMSSIVMSRLLSAEHIYVRFAADVLYAPDGCTGSCSTIAAVSRMLQCRWMSWKIFKAAVHECLARAESSRLKQRDEESDEEEETAALAQPDFDNPKDQDSLPYLHLHAAVQLPEKLLRGPWSSDATSFLHYLLWNSASVDWNRSSRGEVATQGLQRAISARNRTAVACLLSPAVGVVPSGPAIKAAVMDHGCDKTIAFHLLQAALRAHVCARVDGSQPMTDFSFKDPSLWSWAARAKAAGNEKGQWLIGALRYAADAALGNSVYDETTHDDFVRACGREEEDGVAVVDVPLQLGGRA